MADRCEVAVVGGGVVGAATALALTQAGFDVRLLERGAPPPSPVEALAAPVDARVYALAPASAELLAALGVWRELPRLGAYQAMQVWESAPERALQFAAAEVGRTQLGWIGEQSLLLAALWQALPAHVAHSRTDVLDAHFDEPGAALSLSTGELQAQLVVAAEGVNSPLRERAGIGTLDRDYEQVALVAHLRTERPHRGVALQRFLPGGPLAFLPLADGRRSIVWSLPVAEARELLALAADEFHLRLAEAIQHETGAITESTPRLSFPLRLLHAQAFARERLVLAGDSAHVIHPLAGQGLNLGLGDVAQLVQTLRAARDDGVDWSAPRVLRRYERARQAAAAEMALLTDGLDRAFRAPLAGLPRLLDHGLALVNRAAPIKRALILRALAAG